MPNTHTNTHTTTAPTTTAPTTSPTPSCLIIADGSPPALLSAWLEGACLPTPPGTDPFSTTGPLLWRPAGLSTPAALSVEALAQRCHASAIVDAAVPHAITGLAASAMLMAAGEEALARGIDRVLWPIQFPGDLTSDARLTLVASALDRAMLAARLLSIDSPSPGLLIQTPMVELTDHQLMDLAGDTDAPLGCAAWTLTATPNTHDQTAREQIKRWQAAMLAAGIVPAIAGLDAAEHASTSTLTATA